MHKNDAATFYNQQWSHTYRALATAGKSHTCKQCSSYKYNCIFLRVIVGSTKREKGSNHDFVILTLFTITK